jgi:hypothetical protein
LTDWDEYTELANTLAATPTRLKQTDDTLQERLINRGYAITDAAMRKYCGVTPSEFSVPCQRGLKRGNSRSV